ncbi:Hypothetical protein CINCED_3A005012 [Cinara cedri]|uniref:Uncharacterized protein n=1 Tax=Cinara cedri TaxID=506608 RepID=A0A5E4N2H7_9HEMI|nr:Hypothetical protein CINCED_3A005012 [Cinara cedri]
MRVSLMIYNLNVEYFPDKYLYLADLLSRNFKQEIKNLDNTLKDIVHTMKIKVRFRNNKEAEFKKADNIKNDLMCGSQDIFSKRWQFEIISSNLYYAKSNGLAENGWDSKKNGYQSYI